MTPTGSRHNVNLHEKNNMTCERYIHIQKETIQTLLAYFSSTSCRINLYDDFSQSEIPSLVHKPVKNSQMSLKTPHKLFWVLETTCYVKKEI